MVRVKICGITNSEDALAAVEAGADALGFIFVPGTPRYVSIDTASQIASAIPPFVSRVGVFVDTQQDSLNNIIRAGGLDAVQLHGRETPEYCLAVQSPVIKSFRVRDISSLAGIERYRVAAFLLDTYIAGLPGGTGISFDWGLAHHAAKYGPVILSGGLNADNVSEAIRIARPYGVDVGSGVESSPGRKDHRKMSAFIEAVVAASDDMSIAT
jgi:phosphoribosylanthranilate isomerase